MWIMVEQRVGLHEAYDSDTLRGKIAEVSSLDEYRALLRDTLPNVPVEAFLYDFAAQLDLVEVMHRYAAKTKVEKETPVVILKEPGRTDAGTPTKGGTTMSEAMRFRLHDPHHIYYYNRFPQTEPLKITFIGVENANAVELYPLNRVPDEGGVAQVYDYTLRLWQPNGQGTFQGVGQSSRTGGARLQRVYDGTTPSQ